MRDRCPHRVIIWRFTAFSALQQYGIHIFRRDLHMLESSSEMFYLRCIAHNPNDMAIWQFTSSSAHCFRGLHIFQCANHEAENLYARFYFICGSDGLCYKSAYSDSMESVCIDGVICTFFDVLAIYQKIYI